MSEANPRRSAGHAPVDASWLGVIRLAAPAIAVSVLQTVVYLADTIMLGRYGRDALASMQVQGPVTWSIFSVALGATAGTVALVSRAAGQGDGPRVRAVGRAALGLALALGLSVGCVGALSAASIAGAMTPDPAIAALSTGYLRWAFAAFPATAFAAAAVMLFNGTGDTKTPFRVGVLTNALNVGANRLLIWGGRLGPWSIPELGVEGAALGTALAFSVEAALLASLLARRSGRWGPSPPRVAVAAARRDLWAISAPAVLERVAIHAGFLWFARIVNGQGAEVMAANQALVGLEAIGFLGAEGFGVAAATVVGQQLGRGDPDQAARGAWRASALGAAALGACGLGVWLAASRLLWIFADASDPELAASMVERARAAVPLLALAQPFMAGAVILGHALRGAGDTRAPLGVAVTGALAIRVVLAALFARLELGVVGVWCATTIDWGVRCLALIAVFRRGRWQKIRVSRA